MDDFISRQAAAKMKETAKLLKEWGYSDVCYSSSNKEDDIMVRRSGTNIVEFANIIPKEIFRGISDDGRWVSLDSIINFKPKVFISGASYDYIEKILRELGFDLDNTVLIKFVISENELFIRIGDGKQFLATDSVGFTDRCTHLNPGDNYKWNEIGVGECKCEE